MAWRSRPHGDPGAMRREADRLRHLASRIARSGQRLPDVPTSIFRGPAGDRLRGRLSDHRRESDRAAARVRAAADRLSREADRREAAIRAWEEEQRREQTARWRA